MKLQWPLNTLPNQEPLISQLFGQNPQLYTQFEVPAPNGGTEPMQGHDGIDMPTPIGTPVFAAHDGFIGGANMDNRGYGLYITQHWIEDGVIYELIYGHFDSIHYPDISENVLDNTRPVKQGDIIGLSGNTGNSTGPHLHLGLRIYNLQGQIQNQTNGFNGCVDPLPYLRGDIMTGQMSTQEKKGELRVVIRAATMDEWKMLGTIMGFDPSAPAQETVVDK